MGVLSPSPALFAMGVIILAAGAFAALVIGNGVKRTMALLAAHIGAAVLVAVLGGSALAGLAVLTLAAGVGATVLAAALTARIEEAYGGAETHALGLIDERADHNGAAT